MTPAQDFPLLDGGQMRLCPTFLTTDDADRLLAELVTQVPWSQKAIRIAGRHVLQPRLTAWFGDPDAVYTYSGLRNEPLAWRPSLQALRIQLETVLTTPFNSVLLNWYRDGDDAMGAHADNEPELGPNPVIASVSLGATRRFVIAHRHDKTSRFTLELGHGSVLIMAGTTQHHYKHGVPRQRGVGARINLTFRHVLPRQ